MKKSLFMIACAAMMAIACEDIKDDVIGSGDLPSIDDLPSIIGKEESANLSQTQQKQKLDTVARDFMEQLPAEDFKTYSDILGTFEEGFFGNKKGYDWSEVTDRIDADALLVYSYKEDTLKVNNYKRTIELLIKLSNHKGLITIGQDKATVTEYNGTKVVTVVNGKTYEAELTQKGKITEGYISFSSLLEYKEFRGDWDDTFTEYITELVTGKEEANSKIRLFIPEELKLDVTEDGASLASITFKFTPVFKEKKMSLTTDAFAMDVVMKTSNGLEFNVAKAGYNGATNEAMGSFVFKKDGKALITAAAYGKVDIVEDKYEIDETWTENGEDLYYKYSGTTVTVKKSEKATIALDILQQLQIKGECSDIDELVKAVNNFYDAESDSDRTRFLGNVNAKLDLGVYYNLGSNKQASVEFISDYYEDEWEGYTYYELIPVIKFNDGSSHKFEEFFSDQIFESLMQAVSEFGNSYGTMFGFAREEDYIQSGPEYGFEVNVPEDGTR